MTTIDGAAEVSSAEVGSVLKLTRQRVNQLAADGIMKRTPGGEFILADAVEAYIEWKVERAAEASRQVNVDRLKDMKAREIEQKLDVQSRKLVPLAEATEIFDLVTGAFMSAMGSLPARITRQKRERQRIEAILDDVRSRLAKDFDKRRDHLETGVDPDLSDGETDA